MSEMSEEKIIAESYSNLKSAILLGRTDIVRGILSTAAESKHVVISSYNPELILCVVLLSFCQVCCSCVKRMVYKYKHL